ncbi:DegT/DnrJ/EryC1/StrS family aminotransferase [Klenkia terrae]|uniref:DegT/DnrJ/EryC1/StrS family aminotransferase n=1 Tax=Klenkia terrae TaxID=1052259 RepID=A0ABU8E3G0_9ACTN
MTTPPMIPVAKPLIGDDERAAVDRVLRSGMMAQGPEVAAFEQEFAEALVQGRECVAVNSGTSGLHLGLLAAGIGPGDEVVVPSFTFAATANSVALTGATPVFADIDPVSFCLDPASVEAVVTGRTAAIMPVHLYGHPADVAGLAAVAERHGLALFEDAAQAHGAAQDGRAVGTFGAFGMFSLYPTKNMTSGEGGMVSCDGEVARKVRLLRNQGMAAQYQNEVVGLNNRMTDIHAAIGRVQLGRLPAWTTTRQRNAAYLDAHLEGVATPTVRAGATHVYHQYTVRVDGDRDRMVQALREEHGVGSGVYYPVPNHRLASFALDLDLPETEKAAREVISLPVHPSLTSDDLDRVVQAVNTVARAGA